ncbi:hypothetical protein A9Q98_03125 [Thalassotalea sp. 42_200_T64]|nr:hypothetical protein A9Q98_03125 [Thalassotalea sp. 42_200_T64]
MQHFKIIPLSLLISSSLLLTACGGSDSKTNTTKVSFALADAPVDDAAEVWIAVDAIELVKEGEDNILLDVKDGDLEYAQIDLKQFQGGDSKIILDETELAPGVYQNLILHVLDESVGDNFSYVTELDGDEIAMKQPSQKLKLGGFEVSSQGVQRFTIHFDLRTALVQNQNGQRYNLKPHGVTIVDNETVASLSGMVDANLFSCIGDDNEGNFVYLYPGHSLPVLVDNYDANTMQTDLPEGAVAPTGSTAVVLNGNDHSYAFGFIPEGNYTVAFTCSGLNDDEALYDGLVIPNPSMQMHEVVLSNDMDSVQNFEEILP